MPVIAWGLGGMAALALAVLTFTRMATTPTPAAPAAARGGTGSVSPTGEPHPERRPTLSPAAPSGCGDPRHAAGLAEWRRTFCPRGPHSEGLAAGGPGAGRWTLVGLIRQDRAGTTAPHAGWFSCPMEPSGCSRSTASQAAPLTWGRYQRLHRIPKGPQPQPPNRHGGETRRSGELPRCRPGPHGEQELTALRRRPRYRSPSTAPPA